VPDADGEADGEQELSGEEPRGGGDARLDVDDLSCMSRARPSVCGCVCVLSVHPFVGVPDADGEADGQQELSGEEPRGGGDARLDVDDLSCMCRARPSVCGCVCFMSVRPSVCRCA